jgi:hypothetical protein
VLLNTVAETQGLIKKLNGLQWYGTKLKAVLSKYQFDAFQGQTVQQMPEPKYYVDQMPQLEDCHDDQMPELEFCDNEMPELEFCGATAVSCQ